MTDEDLLRRAFTDGVPMPPPAPARAAEARARARAAVRRRAVVTVGAAALAVGAAVSVPVLAGDGSRDTSPTRPATAPATAPTATSGGPVVCPVPRDRTGRSGPTELHEGAVAVRICRGPESSLPILAPADVLTTGVDDLVAAVNGTEPHPEDSECTADLGLGYTLVFGYADGSTQEVTGELYGCHVLLLGGELRRGSEEVWDLVLDRLRAQRASSEPGDVLTPRLGCLRDRDGQSPLGTPEEIETAVACVTEQGPGGPPGAEVPLDRGDLATLLAGLRDAVPDPDFASCRAPVVEIVGATRWGDRVVVTALCGRIFAADGPALRPDAATRDLLDRLVDQAAD